MGYEFEVLNPDIDEKSIRDTNPAELVLKIARAKSKALLDKIKSDDILISSDQVTVYENEIREKPINYEEAEKYLRSYSNSSVATYTSLVVYNKATQKTVEGVDIAKVYFDQISDSDIKKLLERESILRCAGGFSVHDPVLEKHIQKIEGEIDSIAGLPPTLLKKLLKEVEE
jgi:septum formation protein